MADRPITVVILENHDVVIDGVRGWCFRAEPPIHLIAAGTQLGRAWTDEGADADVVVFDLGWRQEGAYEFHDLRRLVSNNRNVVVFSGEDDPEIVLQCGRLGAKAYVTKAEGEEHLIHAIRAAANGETYTTPKHAGMIIADLPHDRPILSDRQIEVLCAWCGGLSKARVAAKLHLTIRTVSTYIERARQHYERVGRPARDKVAMTNRMVEDGYLTRDQTDPLAPELDPHTAQR